MNRRQLILAATCAFVATSDASAQAAVDGPGGRFEDDLISNLEGQWRIARQIRGTTVQNTARAAWVLNHQFLQLHMRDVADPPLYEAIVLIGYVYSEKKYVALWTDTFGAKFAFVGRGARIGNSIEFKFGEPDATFFNTFTWLPDKHEWVFRMESLGASGGRSLFAIDTLSPLK